MVASAAAKVGHGSALPPVILESDALEQLSKSGIAPRRLHRGEEQRAGESILIAALRSYERPGTGCEVISLEDRKAFSSAPNAVQAVATRNASPAFA